MLICPRCQFENANNNQFCQKCGLTLTATECVTCGEAVAFTEANCPACGATTGVFWWTVISDTSGSPIMSQEYLDLGKRYRFITPPQSQSSWQGQVIDCQPLQKSVLKVLLAEQPELLNESNRFLWHDRALPPGLADYAALGNFSPALPEIHDGWQEGSREIILLADRSSWSLLTSLISDEPPLLQLIYWLDEMAKLWKSLEQSNCTKSLLIKDNLRVDEDQIFGLQQLYINENPEQSSLKTLAQFWQDLLNGVRSEELASLITKILTGEIDSVAHLRLQLQELADQKQGVEISPDPIVNKSENPEDKVVEPFDTEPGPILQETDEAEESPTAVIPMELASLTDAGYTDIGTQRRHNEDAFGLLTEIKKRQSNRGQKFKAKAIYILCDGMGGHAAGEVASAIAVNTLKDYFSALGADELPGKEIINEAILKANQAIYQINQDKETYGSGRMGTTLVLALIHNTKVAIAHVGDSRVYRINRKWGLEQLTRDHEVGQRAIQDGVDPKIAYSRPDAYQLTQALGPHDDQYVKPDIRFFEFQEDTLLLLCSDGLSDNDLVEANYQTYLTPLISSRANLEEGLQKLIALANQKNGHDNITAILVRVKVQPNLEVTCWG
ncbi:MAG: hypothetical protein N5P05_001286 [Chroococcopsis gigantea SAG 12.99]|jgi:protein phosphatase|nr:serine/threonine phosphatase [Chlorogloea purpurea SAG 13.99]MDV2999680.1 hypothetical protein [Chroococcopsis gigantea SAG 12.99]